MTAARPRVRKRRSSRPDHQRSAVGRPRARALRTLAALGSVLVSLAAVLSGAGQAQASLEPSPGAQPYYRFETFAVGASLLKVNVANGNLLLKTDDLSGSGLPISLSRYHNTFGAISSDLSPVWRFGIGMDVKLDFWRPNQAILDMPDGSYVSFHRDSATSPWSTQDGGPGDQTLTLTQNANGQWEVPDRSNNTTMRFGSVSGVYRLVQLVDASGYVYSLTYVNGYATQITDSSSRQIAISRDPVSHQVTSLVDWSGRTVRYGYNSATGLLERVTDVAGAVTSYGYDASGMLVSITDPSLQKTTISYDNSGRVFRLLLPDGERTFLYGRYAVDGKATTGCGASPGDDDEDDATYVIDPSSTVRPAYPQTPRESFDFRGTTYCHDGFGQVFQTLAVGPAVHAPRDFTGDGRADFTIWRPSGGWWATKNPVDGTYLPPVQWGTVGDVPILGDFTGDAKFDITVWRPSNGYWFVRGVSSTPWGAAGDIPVAADYTGDGKTDIAVWRPSNGTWYVRGVTTTPWGAAGDIPVAADFTGDGKADIAVWRPSNGTWYIRGLPPVQWGASGDLPLVADFTGDGVADITIWRPSTGTWAVRNVLTRSYGVSGDYPVPANYFSPARAALAVWRPSDGTWRPDASPATQWGQRGDVPLVGQ